MLVGVVLQCNNVSECGFTAVIMLAGVVLQVQ